MGSAILTLSSPFRMNLCFLTELIFALGALGPDRVLAKQIDVNLKVDVNQGDPPTGQTIVEHTKGFVADLKTLYRELEGLLESPIQDVIDEIITALMAATNKINGYSNDIEKFNEATLELFKVTNEQMLTIDENEEKGNDLYNDILYNEKFEDLFVGDTAVAEQGLKNAVYRFDQLLGDLHYEVCDAQPDLPYCDKKRKGLKKSKPNKIG